MVASQNGLREKVPPFVARLVQRFSPALSPLALDSQ